MEKTDGGTLTTKKMLYKEARECADRVRAGISNVRKDVVELQGREGWAALGYGSWTECVQKEFAQAERYIYYQCKAAQIEQNINDSTKSNCTMVQSGTIPERQLRPLSKLQPEQQRIAWQKAVDTAPDGKVTAAIVSRIVKEMTGSATAKTSPKNTSSEKVSNPINEDAMAVAEDIITQLASRISAEDPKRTAAIGAVKKWCDDIIWKLFSFPCGPGAGQGIVRMMAENPSVKWDKL
jgi:hypothetical protein